jgi:hypothetical protein
MHTATFAHPPANPPGLVSEGLNSSGSNTATIKPPLRRAVYVHVSDLLSAYNIDHTKLEEELQRVKRSRQLAADSVAAATDTGTPESTSSTLGVPTELDTNPHPKKLHPPRGGFNLCV